jgi:hypothetical protein
MRLMKTQQRGHEKEEKQKRKDTGPRRNIDVFMITSDHP